MTDKYELETSKEVCFLLKELFPYKQISQKELATKVKKDYTLISKQLKPLIDETKFVEAKYLDRKRIYEINHSKILAYFGMTSAIEFVYLFVYNSNPKTIAEAKENYQKIKKEKEYSQKLSLLIQRLNKLHYLRDEKANEYYEKAKREAESDYYLIRILQNEINPII